MLGYDQSSIIFDGPAEKLTESPLLPARDLYDELCGAGCVPGEVPGGEAGRLRRAQSR